MIFPGFEWIAAQQKIALAVSSHLGCEVEPKGKPIWLIFGSSKTLTHEVAYEILGLNMTEVVILLGSSSDFSVGFIKWL